jgi:hypothetical protein
MAARFHRHHCGRRAFRWGACLVFVAGSGLGWSSACRAAEACDAPASAKQPDKPAWIGSTAGVSDEVLPPWTPVAASGNVVSVWGRTHKFGSLPFPTSIVTRETEVLAAPITLSGTVDGKPLAWTGPACQLAESKPSVARLTVAADSEALRCEGTVGVEYDGMIRADFKLVPKAGKATIERLALEIPIHARFAKYFYFWPGRWGSAFNAGALPEAGHRGPFKPFVWLGDEWRGLGWFCQSEENFFNPKNDQVIEVERKGDVVTLRVNVIAEPQTIDKPLEYTFGFQATPVKPARPDAWDYRICHMGAYGMEDGNPSLLDQLAQAGVWTVCFHEQWTDIQAYPKTTHGEQLRKLVKACHDHGIQLLLYHGYEMSTIAPEWDAYHEECLVFPRAGGYKRKYQPQIDQTAYIVCYRSVWQDFIADGLDKLMTEYGVDGVYLDGTSEPWGCANVRHGCGYKKAGGSVGPTWPMFATRSMMKRIYTIVKAHNPKGQVNVHQSTCMTTPTLAFATSYWDGEHLQSVRRAPSAEQVLPWEAFRCEFMGHNWGVPAELLWYGSGPFKHGEALTMALLHGVPVRPSGIAQVNQSGKLWRALDRLGRDEGVWLPYWENQDQVRTSPAGVKASVYNRPGKAMIAVVANTGNEPCRAEATFNLADLKQPAELKARDIFTDAEVPIQSGRVEVPLDPLGSAVLWLEPK